jgi:DNA-binding LacI/PurR family transcriptional regulator
VSDYESQARRRLDGVREMFGDVGGEVVVEGAGSSVADGGRAAHAVLERDPGLTAIMAHYDDLAIGALDAARRAGLRVPDDLSVLGYDDGLPAEGGRNGAPGRGAGCGRPALSIPRR